MKWKPYSEFGDDSMNNERETRHDLEERMQRKHEHIEFMRVTTNNVQATDTETVTDPEVTNLLSTKNQNQVPPVVNCDEAKLQTTSLLLGTDLVRPDTGPFCFREALHKTYSSIYMKQNST